MISLVLFLLVVLLAYVFYQYLMTQKEGLGTQNQLPAYFSPFTLNNIPLKMTYWSNRLNGDATTGNIDPYTVANDLKTTARTLNIVLYGDENGINQKFVGMMSSIPFTINNLPVKMNTWANRLNGDPTGGTIDPQSIAHEIQYCSLLLNQVLNGGSTSAMEQPSSGIDRIEIPSEEKIVKVRAEISDTNPPITPYQQTTSISKTTYPSITPYHRTTTASGPGTTPVSETTPVSITPYHRTTTASGPGTTPVSGTTIPGTPVSGTTPASGTTASGPGTTPVSRTTASGPGTTPVSRTTIPGTTPVSGTTIPRTTIPRTTIPGTTIPGTTTSNKFANDKKNKLSDVTTPYTYSTTPLVKPYKATPYKFKKKK